MELKEGYKQTEVGVIPSDWEIHKVNELIDLLTDYDANGSFESVAMNVKVYDYEEFAWYVRSTDLENNTSLNNVKYVDESSYKFLKKTSLFGGELLFLKRGDIGNVYLFEMKTEKATVAPNLYLLKLNQVSNSKYLFYYFMSTIGQRQLKSKNASSTLGALYKDDVKSILVPLPPTKPEQTAIANALSDTDALITSLENLIEKKRKIKQGAMQQLLKPKKGWVVKRLGDCLLRMPEYGINAAAVYYDDTLPTYLRITDISEDGKYIQEGQVSVKHLMAHNYFLTEGDIVFARTGASVGKSYSYDTTDGKLVFAGFLIRLKPNQEILNTRYLKYFTQTRTYWNWVNTNSMRSGQPGLNSTDYTSIEISLPNPNIQSEIVKTLSDMDDEIFALVLKTKKYKNVKQGMMQNLLTGKIRLI